MEGALAYETAQLKIKNELMLKGLYKIKKLIENLSEAGGSTLIDCKAIKSQYDGLLVTLLDEVDIIINE